MNVSILKTPFLMACLIAAILVSCSKSKTTTEPSPPPKPPVDSVSKKDSVKTSFTEVSYEDVTVSSFPMMLDNESNALYVGRIIKAEDTANFQNISSPVTDTNYINKVTIYTDLPTDSIYRTVFASYNENQSYLSAILKNNQSPQISNVPIGTTTEPANNRDLRFNQFRKMVGINIDMDAQLNLGFSDTSALEKKSKLYFLKVDYVRMFINCEQPIYSPFIKITKNDNNWNNLFGSGEPKIISSIAYGISYNLAFVVDTFKLKDFAAAINNFKSVAKMTNYDGLSASDKAIFKNTKVYAIVLGKGKVSYDNAEDALMATASSYNKMLTDLTFGGYPISYTLANISDFSIYTQSFKLAAYNTATKNIPKP